MRLGMMHNIQTMTLTSANFIVTPAGYVEWADGRTTFIVSKKNCTGAECLGGSCEHTQVES